MKLPIAFEVTVTKEDFENSSQYYMDNGHCPLATAIRRLFRGYGVSYISVGTRFIDIGDTSYTSDEGFTEDDFYRLENDGVEKTILFIED